MLYLNVYLVGQAYGGPEEGGWYYPVGTPLASIPVDSDYKPGKQFFLQQDDNKSTGTKAGIHIRDCDTCKGVRAVDGSRCEDCGLIPDDTKAVWETVLKWQDYFKDEDIVVGLEEGFAQPFGTTRPHYE